jgi:tetratricopeptide (TPR) repeat protein
MTGKYFLICTYLFVTSSIKGSTPFTKADSLFQREYYQNAQLEYERIVFLSDNPSGAQVALFKRGMCFKNLKEFQKAYNTLKRINYKFVPDSQTAIYRYNTALCAYLSGNYEDVIFQLASFNDNQLSEFSNNLLLLNILTLNEMQKWNEARGLALEYLRKQPTIKNIDSCSAIINGMYNKSPQIRSHKVANYLAVVPGLGQAYAGKPGEGIINFGCNAAFLGIGVYSVYYQYYLTGYFVGGIGLSKFYFGGHSRTDFLIDQLNYKRSKKFNQQVKNILTNL